MWLLAEAGSDEHGALRDGVPGDQKEGYELHVVEITQEFEYILRCPDKNKAIAIANDARKIAENDYGGYAQYGDAPYGDRYGLWNLLQEAGGHMDFSKITTPFNTDCSQLAACCLVNNGYTISKWINSIKIKDMLTKIGFQAIKYNKALLEKGDILQRYGHVAVCVQVDKEDIMYYANLISSKEEKMWASGAGPKTRKAPYVTVKKANIGFVPGVIVCQQKGEILANSQWVRGQQHIYVANYENNATAGIAVGTKSGYFNPDVSTIQIPVRFASSEYIVKIYP